jgi:hypothetical protein
MIGENVLNWWDSADAVKGVNSKLTLAFAVLGGAAGLFGLLAWFTSERVAKLQDQSEGILHTRVQAAEGAVALREKNEEVLRERLESAEAAVDSQKRDADALRERLQLAEAVASTAQTQAHAATEAQKDRSLSGHARERFIQELGRVPKGPIGVTALMSDREGEALAQQIYQALLSAGWNPTGVNSAAMLPGPSGIFVEVANGSSPPAHAAGIQRALKAAGFDAPGNVVNGLPQDTVEILVGYKPIQHKTGQ